MEQNKYPEKDSSPELSPNELIVRMSEKADTVFLDTSDNPRAYFGVEDDVTDSGVVNNSLISFEKGASLNRSYNPESNAASYELSIPVHQGGRGELNYSWSTLEGDVKHYQDGDLRGRTDTVSLTEVAKIKRVQSLLETYFPIQSEKETIDDSSEDISYRAERDKSSNKGNKFLRALGIKRPR